MAPIEDNDDSGMESQEGSQANDLPPVQKPEQSGGKVREIEMNYDDEPDETLGERLWGLTEMFPEPVRNATYTTAMATKCGIKSLYSFSRTAFWIIFSSSIILFAPVIFEVERTQMDEMQRNTQKQMLLGPSTAISPGAAMPPISAPPMQR